MRGRRSRVTSARFGGMTDTDRDLADIKATQGRLEPMLSKLVDGRIEGRGQWLQTMDPRFTAPMHPYEPRKPAAE